MMQAKAFQAQPLDNRSPDLLRLAGSLDELRGPAREQTYSAMADISSRGETLFFQDGVRLVAKGSSAVLQVVPKERDDAGRLAPIMCWVETASPDAAAAGDVDAVWASVLRFSEAIGRSFTDNTRSAVCGALDVFEKKKRMSRPAKATRPSPARVRWTNWLAFRWILAILRILKKPM